MRDMPAFFEMITKFSRNPHTAGFVKSSGIEDDLRKKLYSIQDGEANRFSDEVQIISSLMDRLPISFFSKTSTTSTTPPQTLYK